MVLPNLHLWLIFMVGPMRKKVLMERGVRIWEMRAPNIKSGFMGLDWELHVPKPLLLADLGGLLR
jgi:hypothetical protein